MKVNHLAAFIALSAPAFADLTSPYTPSFRGDPGAEYGHWDNWTSAFMGPNAPDDPASNNPDALLFQMNPGAIVTSGMIYSPAGPTEFMIVDSVTGAFGDLQEVVLQFATAGIEMDYESVYLRYGDHIDVPFQYSVEMSSTANPSGLGVNVEMLYYWDLSSFGDDIQSFSLHFTSSGPHMGLDAVMLDTREGVGNVGAPYCFGDGSSTACPCGNAGAPGRGCGNGAFPAGAELSGQGSASIANDNLVLNISDMPQNQPVLFFGGGNAVNSGNGNVFGDGLRCAGFGVNRLEVSTSDSSGIASTSSSISTRDGVSIGDIRRYQAWYRDPVTTLCGSGFNLSNGLEITWN
ncbi:MAG: hypothetical protein MK297_03680 [Planctomycetes bacterium]|nr:hypothetical protein [Planctomycetota bacterium]